MFILVISWFRHYNFFVLEALSFTISLDYTGVSLTSVSRICIGGTEESADA